MNPDPSNQCFVADIIARYRFAKRVDGATRLLSLPDRLVTWVLRRHRGGSVLWRGTAYRNDLNAMLHAISAVRVGWGPGLDWTDQYGVSSAQVAAILGHPLVRRYYSSEYLMPSAALVLAEYHDMRVAGPPYLPDRYYKADMLEPRDEAWEERYLRFLALDASVGATPPLRDFMNVIDGGRHNGAGFENVAAAMRDISQLSAWLESEESWTLLEGVQHLLMLAQDLHDLLDDLWDRPAMRGLVWLHHAHWLVQRGTRLFEVARWLDHAWYRILHGTDFSELAGLTEFTSKADRPAVEIAAQLIQIGNFPADFLRLTGEDFAAFVYGADYSVEAPRIPTPA
jgi:hypothetical protein